MPTQHQFTSQTMEGEKEIAQYFVPAVAFATFTARAGQARDHSNWERQKNYWPGIAMNAERSSDANLRFEPSMKRADGAIAIAIIEGATINYRMTVLAKRSLNVFKGGTKDAAQKAVAKAEAAATYR